MEENVSLSPINFFQVSIDCHALPSTKEESFALTPKNYQKYLLPDLSALNGDDSFAKLGIGWNREGVEILARMDQPYARAQYPQFEKGDSLEVCIDTRDVKTSGYNTRFCHHFVFLPEAVEGLQAAELTKFRTEDAHEPCSSADLKVQSVLKPDHYMIHCFIPAHCLHGYDPDQFDRFGMTYRINRANGSPQHFSVLSGEYKFQEQPSLWSSVRIVK
jgi:hypothetical protein